MALFGALSNGIGRLTIGNRIPPTVFYTHQANYSKAAKSVVGIPPKPKKPISAYLRFTQQNREQLMKAQPGLKSTAVLTKLAEAWSALSPEAKKPFQDAYVADLVNYKKQEDKWREGLSEKQEAEYELARVEKRDKLANRRAKAKLKLLGKPRGRLSAFNFYMSEAQNKRGETPLAESFTIAAKNWKTLTPLQKKPYEEMSIKDKERYDLEMREWQQEMAEHGQSLPSLRVMKGRPPLEEKSIPASSKTSKK